MKENRLSSEQLAFLCEQLAMLMDSNILIQDGLDMILEDMEDNNTKKILEKLQVSIVEYKTLSKALEVVAVFPKYMVQMLKVGEESGKKDDVMRRLAKYYEKETWIKSAIKRAIIYPILLLAMMGMVILIITTKVLPIFKEILQNLGSQLSGFGVRLMVIGMTISQYSTVIIITLIVLLLLIITLLKWGNGLEYRQKILEKTKLYEVISLQRLSEAMGIMLASGTDMTCALKLAVELVDHRKIKEKLEKIIDDMQQGKGFEESLKAQEIYGKMDTYQLIIGIQTAHTDEVMQKISDHYTEKIETTLQSGISIVEPTVVIVLAIVIGSILTSVMFPLMGIMSSIG